MLLIVQGGTIRKKIDLARGWRNYKMTKIVGRERINLVRLKHHFFRLTLLAMHAKNMSKKTMDRHLFGRLED